MSNEQANEGTNWNFAFRNWEDLTPRETIICEISDLHKEVFGFRPRPDWATIPDERLQLMRDSLAIQAREQFQAEQLEECEHRLAVAEAMTEKKWTLGDLINLPEVQ